jgi:hypothetical protein
MPTKKKKTSPRTASKPSGSLRSKPGVKPALQALALAMKQLKAR